MGRLQKDRSQSEQSDEFFGSNIKPWERQRHESVKAYNYFCNYRDINFKERTLSTAAKQIGSTTNYMVQLSAKYHWAKRVAAWDAYLDKRVRDAKIKEIEEMAKRHSKHSQAVETALMTPVNKYLNKVSQNYGDLEDMNVSELLDLVFSAADRLPKIVDTERKSRGVPTDISKSSVDHTTDGEPLQPAINIIVNGSKSPILEEMSKTPKADESNG